MSKPCVLCIARLRAAIEANDSPSTGSMPPTSIFTTPVPSPGGTAAPVPGTPTLWTIRKGCHGVSSPSCSGNAARVAGELESLNGEHGGRGVMAVSGAGFGEKRVTITSGPEGADHAHDVSQDFLPVPDPQRLLGNPSKTRSLSRG